MALSVAVASRTRYPTRRGVLFALERGGSAAVEDRDGSPFPKGAEGQLELARAPRGSVVMASVVRHK